MEKATCRVSVLAIRKTAEETSEMLSQMLYGERCSIGEVAGNYAKITCDFDGVEGWVWRHSLQKNTPETSATVVENAFGYLDTQQGKTLISIGSELDFQIETTEKPSLGEAIAQVAQKFINVPYLYGGRSFFGVDASAFVQLVYKANGISLPRYAFQQAERGEALAFLEESEAGDLAFFEDENGTISHCGIMLNSYELIHCYGSVRVDALDSSGIFNQELGKHTHRLRFIKRVF